MRSLSAQRIILAATIIVLSAGLYPRAAWAQTPCDAAFEKANRIYYDNWIQWQAVLERAGSPELQVFHDVVRLAREARACQDTTDTDQIRRIYSREIYGLIALGRFEEAFDAFDAFFDDVSPDSVWTPFMYKFRAQADTWTGRLALAAAHQVSAIRFAAGHPKVERAELYYDLGRIYQRMQDFNNALTYTRNAISLIGQEEEESAFRTLIEAKAYHQLGDIILERSSYEPKWQDSLEVAVRLVDKALDLYNTQEPSRDLAGGLILRGSLARILGDTAEAITYIAHAENMTRQLGDNGMRAFAAVNRSRVLADKARWREAERILIEALHLVDAGRMDFDHRRRVLGELAYVYEQSGRLAEADRIHHELIDFVEALRARLGTTEWSLSAFSRWQRWAYQGLVRVLLQEGRYEEAFLTLERSRARYASDLLSARAALSRLPREERMRYERMTEELATIRTRLLHEPYGSAEYVRLLDDETRLVADRAAAIAAPDSIANLTLESIQRRLSERGQTLLSYFITGPDQETTSHVFVVTRDTLLAIPLSRAPSDAIEAAIRSVSGALSASEDGLHLSDRQFSLDALHDLYVRVFEPVEKYLEAGTRLAIVPSGPLHGLPFGALVEEKVSGYAYGTAPYLIRRFPISHEPGAAMLIAESGTRHTHGPEVVAFGRTRYAADSLLAASLPPPVRDGLSVGADLPAVRSEIASVTSLFWKSRALLDDEATEHAFYESMAGPSVLHIASHVVVDESTPMMSAILLSDSQAEADDGIIYLHELMGRPLAADLVVLSGCNTARGVYRSGEGSLGLHYAFRTMGAASSVSTLWLADDDAMAGLMRTFYLGLRSGLPKDVALQQAQVAYLEEAGKSTLSPFFWAAPVLYGNPEPISLRRSYIGLPLSVWYVLVLFAAVSVAAAGSHKFRQRKTPRPTVLKNS